MEKKMDKPSMFSLQQMYLVIQLSMWLHTILPLTRATINVTIMTMLASPPNLPLGMEIIHSLENPVEVPLTQRHQLKIAGPSEGSSAMAGIV